MTSLNNSAFGLLHLFNLANIHTATASEEYEAFKDYNFDLNIGDKSRVLCLNIISQGPYDNDSKNEYKIWPFTYLNNDAYVWSEINHKFHFSGLPIKNGNLKSITEFQADETNNLLNRIAIFITWHAGDSIIENHMVQAAEALHKKDSVKMIYNIFSAIELKIRKIDRDWSGRKESTHQPHINKIISRISEISKEISIPYDKNQLLNDLREHRNDVVHTGKLSDKYKRESDNIFFALACWYLMYFNILEEILAKNLTT